MESNTAMKYFLIVCSVFVCVNSVRKPADISEDMFCLGCQVTVKELDFMLSKKPTRGMGETVTRALKRVCDIHNFDKYDYDAKKVLKVCQAIRGDEGMEAVLITEYGRKHATGKQTTYIDITEMICGTVLKACVEKGKLESNSEDGGITYDPVVEDFYVTHGKKVRVPHPVREAGGEPNETTETENAGHTEPEVEEKETKPEIVMVSDNADSHDEL